MLGMIVDTLVLVDVIVLLYALIKMKQQTFLQKNPNIFYMGLTFFALLFHFLSSTTWAVLLLISSWVITFWNLIAAFATNFSFGLC